MYCDSTNRFNISNTITIFIRLNSYWKPAISTLYTASIEPWHLAFCNNSQGRV